MHHPTCTFPPGHVPVQTNFQYEQVISNGMFARRVSDGAIDGGATDDGQCGPRSRLLLEARVGRLMIGTNIRTISNNRMPWMRLGVLNDRQGDEKAHVRVVRFCWPQLHHNSPHPTSTSTGKPCRYWSDSHWSGSNYHRQPIARRCLCQ